jgi:hypothetical protein
MALAVQNTLNYSCSSTPGATTQFSLRPFHTNQPKPLTSRSWGKGLTCSSRTSTTSRTRWARRALGVGGHDG